MKAITIGRYTYAKIDDEKWYYAIVKDYEDCQSYGDVICGFEEYALPSREIIELFLLSLDGRDFVIEYGYEEQSENTN